MKIPPKVKKILWHVVTNCLPTKDMLLTRRVQVSVFCPMCNIHTEIVLHIVVLCPQAVSSWKRTNFPQICGNFDSFSEWLQLVFQQRQGEDTLIAVMICWMLWKSRNELIWKQRSLTNQEVVGLAFTVLKQW